MRPTFPTTVATPSKTVSTTRKRYGLRKPSRRSKVLKQIAFPERRGAGRRGHSTAEGPREPRPRPHGHLPSPLFGLRPWRYSDGGPRSGPCAPPPSARRPAELAVRSRDRG